ncbi:MAG: phosphate:Na+ symporter, partial [Planctomycetota bacterium]
ALGSTQEQENANEVGAWPAESEKEATNLSALSRGFRKDLSGATWNPFTKTFWVCRNGNTSEGRIWAMVENGDGGLEIATQDGERAKWDGLGDCEGITFAQFDENVVFLALEDKQEIHELDVSKFGEFTQKQVYDAKSILPGKGEVGIEGITFVPDENLIRAGFVDADGVPRTSRSGMNGLMFVGHQGNGGIYVLDLDRATGAVELVGQFRVMQDGSPLSKVVALEFDRKTDELFVWHDVGKKGILSRLELGSTAVDGKDYRALNVLGLYNGPSKRNVEGLAITDLSECADGCRSLLLTVDDGKGHSLFRFDHFDTDGDCGQTPGTIVGEAASPASDANGWSMFFAVLGGLGIFLIGMRNLSEGMQAIAGKRLRQMINAVTDNRLMAVAVGTGVTCLVQSSSITTVIVVGFVNSGLMQLKQAIGVIMGANIGTTITGWILVLKIGKFGLPIVGASALVYLFSKRDRWRYIGMAVMGLGMIFFGLELMKDGVKPMRSIPAFTEAFAWFAADSYIGVLKCAALGCFLTLLVQSSSATLGITISLAVTGTIPFQTAAALVLGENLGTTITAWLASIGSGTAAKRAAYAHIAFNLLGVFWITLIFSYYIQLIGHVVEWKSGLDLFSSEFTPDNTTIAFATTITFAIAAVHTGFNVANTVLFIGLLPLMARLLERFIPERAKERASGLNLDPSTMESAVFTIQQSHAVINKMAGEIQEMLEWTRAILEDSEPDEELVRSVFQHEERADEFQEDVILFLTNILSAETPHNVVVEARQQLRIVDEFESVSDYVSSVVKARLRLQEQEMHLMPSEIGPLLTVHDEVAQYVDHISRSFADPKVRDLDYALTESDTIRQHIKELRNAHLELLSEARVDPQKSMAFSTILNSYRKVKDHALNIAESLATI